MKKIAYSLMALALAAFTFTSCEDVPAPFDQPTDPSQNPTGEVIEPSGDGTAASPFNVAAAIKYVQDLGSDVESTSDVYISGTITAVTEEYGTQFGNATFVISDDENSSNKFTFYRGLYLGNKKYSNASATNIKIGDKVVICGKVVNYRGNTPETVQNGAYLYSLNGEGGDSTPQPTGEAKGTGTETDPYNVAAVLAYVNSLGKDVTSPNEVYVKGKISAVTEKFGTQFGNATFVITDEGAGNEFTFYRGLYFGKQKYSDNSALNVKVGDEVVICGKVVLFRGNTPETSQNDAYIVSINGATDGGGSGEVTPTPTGDGEGSEANPYNVPAAIAKAEQTGVFVKAYIVGWVDGQVYESGCNFNGASSSATNILIAASADENDPAKCMPVQLPSGAVRTGINLLDNPGNYKKEVLLYGDITTYFRVPGLKNTKYAKIGSTEFGNKPSSGQGTDEPTPSGQGALDINFLYGQADWTIVDMKPLASGINYVWKADAQYGMKASAYVSGTRYETDSWLISPVVTMPNGGTLAIEHTQRFAASGCTDLHIMVSTSDVSSSIDTGKWTEVSPNEWPSGSSWDFMTSKVTLPAGTVRVAFRYTSTTTTAATWEIKTLKVE